MKEYFKQFQLSEKNLAERKLKVTGTDICILADGDPEKVFKLYKEKTNQLPPDDLTKVWPVIMGHITETANLEWQEMENNFLIRHRQQVIDGEKVTDEKEKKYNFMRCTIDGAIEPYKGAVAVIDAKFTFGRPRKDEEYKDVIPRLMKYYSPQLHWNAFLLENYLKRPVKYGLLSFIKAGDKPLLEEMKIDKDYQKELIEVGNYFHNCVVHGFDPVDLPSIQDFVPEGDLIPISMEQDEKWKQFANQIIQTDGANRIYKEACDGLKKLVPDNAKECFGHGVKIKVQKNGSKRVEIWKK